MESSEGCSVVYSGAARAARRAKEELSEKREPSRHARAELVPIDQKHHLGYFSTAGLILNKSIGSGVYLSPALVLSAIGSKGVSLMLWIVGCLMTWAGMFVYLEYGIRWPLNGGELYYIDKVWTKRTKLFTYIFSSIFVIANGSHNNALIFAKQVILASSAQNATVNPGLQKFLAIVITTFICQLLAFSRSIYIKISYIVIIFKVSVLCFIGLAGLVSLTGARRHSSDMINTPYGLDNLRNDFSSEKGDPFQYSMAMLNIMRAFLGYENANFVLKEVKTGPDGDERRTFRRAAKIAVATLCVLYIMVNVAFFSVCTTDEIVNGPETLVIFFEKVFGPSGSANLATCITISISALGALMALTFANVRVKQEIGRLGILPYSEFWAKTSHRRTPAPALFLHWIFTVLFIAIAPLNLANGFSVISTFYSYVHTYISITIGIALLCAPWLSSFKYTDREDNQFRPQSSWFGYWLLGPLVVIYIVTNAAVLVLSWIPVNEQKVLNTTHPTLPYYSGPVAALGIIAIGILWWCWERHVLPKLGYEFRVTEEEAESAEWGISTVRVNFYRELRGPAERFWNFLFPIFDRCRKLLQEENASVSGGSEQSLIGNRDEVLARPS